MAISSKEIVPFTHARAHLSELVDEVKAGAGKIITKNGESCVALVDAAPTASHTVYLRSIHHHRQLSFDFAGLWSGA